MDMGEIWVQLVKNLRRVGEGLFIAAVACFIGYWLVAMQGNMLFERYTGGNAVYEWTPLEEILFWSVLGLTAAACIVFLLAAHFNRKSKAKGTNRPPPRSPET
jgi:1,4-dihydroxy-2-naphthoate octaprenyltransferase